jgi:hypothetical protein
VPGQPADIVRTIVLFEQLDDSLRVPLRSRLVNPSSASQSDTSVPPAQGEGMSASPLETPSVPGTHLPADDRGRHQHREHAGGEAPARSGIVDDQPGLGGQHLRVVLRRPAAARRQAFRRDRTATAVLFRPAALHRFLFRGRTDQLGGPVARRPGRARCGRRRPGPRCRVHSGDIVPEPAGARESLRHVGRLDRHRSLYRHAARRSAR